ncbi:Peptidoglycan-associated lipoprotein [Ralstonia condita]|uniref:Peptidoglycan-associated lipoprotein n=1 Tax=Ralstonia condita TaxID=3058600 RepID=A0ABN9IRP6_9RALS|nr:OmpA family protein [Ralstonia sp. LMG 7141]CAJ0791012.1 Peptidoglycan-associated lipoprotein [Ralstonia sp. LMG 7141]
MSIARPTLSRQLIVLAAIAFAAAGMTGCKKKTTLQPAAEASAPAAAAPSAAPASAAAAAPTQSASTPETQPQLVNVAGLSQGAFVVNKPRDNSAWVPMLNEIPDSVGMLVNGDTYEAIIALAAPATIRALRFDRLPEAASARHAQVQVSEQGPNGPWQTLYDADLPPVSGNNSVSNAVKLDKPAAAGWIRLVVSGGGGGSISLQQFAALAEPAQSTPTTRDVTGVYQFGNGFDVSGFVAMKQEGATVRGCYGDGDVSHGKLKVRQVSGTFEGGLEPNGYLRYTRASGKQSWRGVVSFNPDGDRAAVLEFPANATAQTTVFRNAVSSVGWKTAAYQNTCPGLDQDPVSSALEQDKRVTLYGVNFDLDADTLRADSRPALDNVTKAAKAHPDWKLTIEGHTDSSGGDAHNQDLSQRRAASVRQYLIDAGIPADRLTAQGFGASRPVAPNTTPAGRAQNRRVEIARQ